MDKNKSHFLAPEDTEEIRRLEQQELAFWRGSASKRLAGRTRRFSGGNRWLDDGGPETQQRSRSKEEKTARDDREGVKARCQNGRCHGRFRWFSVVMKVQTRILQEIFLCQQHEQEKEFGTVECCDRSGILESVELEFRFSGRRLYRHFPVADFNARRMGCVAVARMFQKTGWGGCWCARIVHAVRTPGRIAMSVSYRKDNRRLSGVRQDGLRSSWKGSKLGEFEATLTEIQEFLNGRPKQHDTNDLGWRLQCEPVIPRTFSPELALSRNLEKERRALKRERHLDKIKESAEMVRAPKKTQSKHFNWKSIAKNENPESQKNRRS